MKPKRQFSLVPRTLAVLLGVALVLSIAGFAAAKSHGLAIEISEVVNDDFPIVRASLTVADSTGLAIPSLSASDFEVLEDGQAVPARDVQVEINDESPLNLVLVVDISTRTDSLDSVQLATLALADQMLPDDQFALMQFADVASVLQGFTGDPDALKIAVTRLEEGGNFSAIYEAVIEAITMAQSVPERRAAVIVFTNSDNNIGDVAPSAVLEYALDAEVPIYAFGYGARVNQEALGELARMSGGEFYYYDTADGIEADLLDLESRLRIGYNLSFRSQMPPDGLSHELTIRASTGSEAGEAVIQYDALRIPISIGVPAFEADEIEGVVELAAQVTAGAQIVSVEYRLDGESLGTSTSPPYLLTWDSTTATTGAHVLEIVATDEAGNDATLEIDVTVLPPEPLTVAIVVGEVEVKLGRAVTVQADAEPADAVGQVDFLVDGMPIASDDAPPYELTLDTADFGIGKHTVSVRVQGAAGQSADAFEDFEIIPRFSLPDITVSRTWIVRVLLILGLIVDVGGAILLFRYLRRMLKKRLVHLYELELANDGNVSGKYELKAEDPTQFLDFKFLLNGADLQILEERVAEPQPVAADAPVTPASASAVQPVAYAQPAMAAPQPQAMAAPPAAAQAQPVPASKKKGGAVKKAGGTARIFVSMASTLGSLLPGAAGKPFTDFSRRAQETQAQAQMAKDKQRMAQREVKSLGDQSKKLGGSTGGGAAQPAPTATPPAQPATPPTQPVAPGGGVSPAHQPTPVAVAPAPAGSNGRGGAPAAARTITRNLEWALTPVIEAGESLTLNLQITPTGTPDSQSYFFKLLSRPAEADDVPVAVEQGSADLTRPSILLRLLPFAVLVVGVVAVGVLARFLLLEFGILA